MSTARCALYSQSTAFQSQQEAAACSACTQANAATAAAVAACVSACTVRHRCRNSQLEDSSHLHSLKCLWGWRHCSSTTSNKFNNLLIHLSYIMNCRMPHVRWLALKVGSRGHGQPPGYKLHCLSKHLQSLLPTDRSMMSFPAALAEDFAASITKKAPDSGVRAERSLTMVF